MVGHREVPFDSVDALNSSPGPCFLRQQLGQLKEDFIRQASAAPYSLLEIHEFLRLARTGAVAPTSQEGNATAIPRESHNGPSLLPFLIYVQAIFSAE